MISFEKKMANVIETVEILNEIKIIPPLQRPAHTDQHTQLIMADQSFDIFSITYIIFCITALSQFMFIN